MKYIIYMLALLFSAGISTMDNSVFVRAAIDSKNRMVIIDNVNTEPFLVRLTSSGALDTTFGGVGFVSIGSPGQLPRAVAIDNKNRIIAVVNASGTVRVVRVLEDGTIDTSYGTNGAFGYALNTSVVRMLIAPDGSLFLGLTPTAGNAFLIKVTPEGFLDVSFGGTSGVNVGMLRAQMQPALQTDGKILLFAEDIAANPDTSIVRRYLPDGSLDTSFGNDGQITISRSPDGFGTSTGAISIVSDFYRSGIFGDGGDNVISRHRVDSLLHSSLSQALWRRYYNRV